MGKKLIISGADFSENCITLISFVVAKGKTQYLSNGNSYTADANSDKVVELDSSEIKAFEGLFKSPSVAENNNTINIKSLYAYILPDSTGISKLLFNTTGTSSLESVSIVNGSNSINNFNYAFDGNTSLIKVKIKSNALLPSFSATAMFRYCSALEELDLSNIDIKNINTVQSMFQGCSKLKDIKFYSSVPAAPTIFSSMFSGCTDLQSVNLIDFSFGNATSLSNMFNGCSALTVIQNIPNDSSSSLTSISGMFNGCFALSSIDISMLNTSVVTNISNLFYNCTSLQSIDMHECDFSAATTTNDIFKNCGALKTINVSGCNNTTKQLMLDAANLIYPGGYVFTLDQETGIISRP